MNDDLDIIRWSQIKRFLKHTIAWMAVYGIGGWLIDVTQYSEHSTTSHFIVLVALSVFMAFVTMERN